MQWLGDSICEGTASKTPAAYLGAWELGSKAGAKGCDASLTAPM